MPVIHITEDSRFQSELSNAGSRLVVVDFFATWCGPCTMVAPQFERLSNTYPQAVFLKVDVDECQGTAFSQGITAMPTFIFYRNSSRLATIQGSDVQGLENKIRELIGGSLSNDGSGTGTISESGGQKPEIVAGGHIDLVALIHKPGSECLNESDQHTFVNCLTNTGDYLESDCDEQLILNLAFSQPVKLHSIKVKGPQDNGPKTLKLFINQTRTLDFDQADSMEPIQLIELSTKDLADGKPILLKYVKFQNVNNLIIFIKDNQSGSETTRVDHITLIGSTVAATNMSEFKRISGKKGESH